MSAPLPKEMNFRDRLESAGVGVREKLYVNPTNGSEFTSGSTFSEFHIPGSRANTFADLKNLYVVASIALKSTDTPDQAITMENAGVLNCVERIEIDSSSGVRIAEVRSKDVIDTIKLYERVDALGEALSTLIGSRANAEAAGVAITTTASQFVIPIDFTSINTMVPLFGNDGLRFRIHWNSSLRVLCQSNDTAPTTVMGANDIRYTGVSMHYDTVKLSEQDMQELFAETDGRFVITGGNYQNQQEVVTANSATINLGFGRSKCKKIYFTMRRTSSIDAPALLSHSYEIDKLTSAELRYNGRLINESSLSFTPSNAPIVVAEMLKQQGKSLLDINTMFAKTSFSTDISATTPPDENDLAGTFMVCFDLTSGADTHLSASGLDTRTGTFQLVLGASAALASTVDVFCEYETKIVLDMRADRVFRVMS